MEINPEAAVEIFYTSLTCSLATRIAVYEAGVPARFCEVLLGRKEPVLAGGGAYREVNPKLQVPALRTDDGRILTEGPAILQHVADLRPASGLAPTGGFARSELQMWLNYVGSEIHKAVFYMIFNGPPEVRAFARDVLLPPRYRFLSAHLARCDHLMDRFTVADAYLVTTLNWPLIAGVDLGQWPVLEGYRARLLERPSVARAFAEEFAERQARQAAAEKKGGRFWWPQELGVRFVPARAGCRHA